MSEAGCPPPRVQSAKKRQCQPKNPFAYRERDNFPGLEFGMTDTKQKAEANYSITSEGSSFLNMSIGARAALNEHMRNVAKYGIDGERPVSDDKGAYTPRNALDAQWDNLLDGNTARVDLSGSFAAVPSSPRLDAMLPDQDGSESLDGLIDLSLDFFNSSRVLMLATPEKNRNHAKNMVVTRDEVQQKETYQEDDSEVSSYANMAPELKGSLGISQHSTERNSSFVSSSVTEVSQISNADESFHGRWTIEENAFSPIKEMGTPSRFQDSQFAPSSGPRFVRNSSSSSSSWTPRRTPPRNTSMSTFPRTNHSTERNSSFVSSSVTEVSQISNADESFHGRWTIEENAFSPIKEMGTPSRFQDSQFAPSSGPRFIRNSSSSSSSWTPRRTPPRNTSMSTFLRTNSTPELPVLGSTSRESTFKQRSTRPYSNGSHKENHLKNMTPTFGYSPAVSPFAVSSGISQAAALAGAQASQMLKDYSRYGAARLAEDNAFDRMPTDFLRAIKSSKDASLSPISQTNLSVVDIASNVGSGSGDGSEGSFTSSRSAKRLKAESPSPFASLTAQYSRRQLHEVNPARVFLESSNEFSEERDIVSVPSPRLNRSENDPTRKSLINSFEEAYFH